jgi:hypothetical protein
MQSLLLLYELAMPATPLADYALQVKETRCLQGRNRG